VRYPAVPRILKFCLCMCFILMEYIIWGVHAVCRREDVATFFFFLPLLKIQVPYHLRAVTVRFMMVKSPAGVTSCDIIKLPNCLILQCVHLA